jgi:hypothetical protein
MMGPLLRQSSRVWSIKVEIETEDLELKSRILSAIGTWQPLCDTMSVITRQKLPMDGRRRRFVHASRKSVRLEAVAVVGEEDQDDETSPD